MAEHGLNMATGTNPADTEPRAIVEVTARDLHGPGVVFCPNPKMPLWSAHPRVFIDVAHGAGKCPYCGTVYRLRDGEKPPGH